MATSETQTGIHDIRAERQVRFAETQADIHFIPAAATSETTQADLRAKLEARFAAVRIGGVGTQRRKTLKKRRSHKAKVRGIVNFYGKTRREFSHVEEVKMFKDDGTVIRFVGPEVLEAPRANTYAIMGHSEEYHPADLPPGILDHLRRPNTIENVFDAEEAFILRSDHTLVHLDLPIVREFSGSDTCAIIGPTQKLTVEDLLFHILKKMGIYIGRKSESAMPSSTEAQHPKPRSQEVIIFEGGDEVIHFPDPKVKRNASGYSITGHGEPKYLEELLPGIFKRLLLASNAGDGKLSERQAALLTEDLREPILLHLRGQSQPLKQAALDILDLLDLSVFAPSPQGRITVRGCGFGFPVLAEVSSHSTSISGLMLKALFEKETGVPIEQQMLMNPIGDADAYDMSSLSDVFVALSRSELDSFHALLAATEPWPVLRHGI